MDGTHRLKRVECKQISKHKVSLATSLTFYSRIFGIQKIKGNQVHVDGNLYTIIGYTKDAKKFVEAYGAATNFARRDKKQGSITFPEGIVVMLASAESKSSVQKSNIKTEPTTYS
jgi:hypothetical protein